MSKKESGKSVLDLERRQTEVVFHGFVCPVVVLRYLNQPVKVKFSGGREVKGILKGDLLMWSREALGRMGRLV